MLNNINEGLKNVFKHKIMFLISIFQITFLTIIFISLTLSLFRDLSFQKNDSRLKMQRQTTFLVAPDSIDLTDLRALSDEAVAIINDSGVTYLHFHIDEGLSVVYIMGDATQLDLNVTSKDILYVNTVVDENQLSDQLIDGRSIKTIDMVDTLFEYRLGLYDMPVAFIKIDDLSEVDVDMVSLNITDLIGIIGNAAIPSSNKEAIAKLELIYADSPFIVRTSEYSIGTDETTFILFYMYPFIGVICLCLIGFSVIIIQSFIKHKVREYTLHMLYGATYTDILIQSSIFNVAAFITFATIIYTIINRTVVDHLFFIALSLGFTMLFIAQMYVFYRLKQQNLNANLRRK